MSKGWLIIGLVLIITGSCLLFLANSLFYDSNQLERHISNEVFNGEMRKIQERFELNGRFLVVASLIIIIIGVIMSMEWLLFSKFLKRFAKE